MAGKILNSFDVWITAQGIKSRTRLRSVDNISFLGISKLRRLILELAIRGKLVQQLKTDEPASHLLKKILKGKQVFVEARKIRKSEPFDLIKGGDKAFPLPSGWEWVRLGDVIEFVNGYAFKSSDYTESGVGIVKIGNIQNGIISPLDMSRVNREVVAKLDDILQVNKGDLVIAMSGATTGKLGFSKADEVFYLNQRVGKIIPFNISSDYLYHYLSTKIDENLTISQGSAIPNLSTVQIKNIVLSLPPLPEQHRIVAKVEELMALCDELEKEETKHLKSHQLLVETLLGTLSQAKDAADFQQAWATLAQHFDELFTTEDSIEQLKQTILQLAVMGKLVPQDPKDEPASELLERIRKEKERLVKEGKIKKFKNIVSITISELPYEIPNGWAWCRLGEPIYYSENLDIQKTLPSDTVINYVDIDSIDNKNYIISEAKTKRVSELSTRARRVLKKGFIVYSTVRPYLKNIAIVEEELPNMIGSTGFNVFRPIKIELKYIFYFLLNPYLNKDYERMMIGFNSPSITNEQFENTLLPLPPVNEQERIVAKVDELFALCDALKERIVEAQKVAKQMAEAVVEQNE